jgi:Flp pilus assembly protein TadD
MANFKMMDHLAYLIKTGDDPDSLSLMIEERIERNLRARDFDEALAGVERMHAVNPEDYGNYLAQAYAFYSLGKYKEARDAVSKAIEVSQNPDLAFFKILTEHRLRETLLQREI